LYVKRLEQIEPTSPLPFLLSPDFLLSPEKSFELPVYAKPLDLAFAAQHIADPIPLTKYLDPGVHELMDVEACESDRSTSHSITTSSSTIDFEDGSI
jgi:hypothetical protein